MASFLYKVKRDNRLIVIHYFFVQMFSSFFVFCINFNLSGMTNNALWHNCVHQSPFVCTFAESMKFEANKLSFRMNAVSQIDPNFRLINQ